MVQSVHAAADYVRCNPDKCVTWAQTSNSIITLAEKDADGLHSLSKKLGKLGVHVQEFYEPDIDNQLTAICCIADDSIRRKLSHLPLALKEFGRENAVA